MAANVLIFISQNGHLTKIKTNKQTNKTKEKKQTKTKNKKQKQKKNSFPKEFLNEMWLIVGEHE